MFVGLQLGQVMSSLDGTIVATALPSIVEDVGGFDRVTWVVTAYTLAMVASMPLYGKLGDLYGRKRVFLVAISIFLTASAMCGLAQSMEQLLVARFVQGLGGGGLGALAMATIADIVPARQLGRWLGYQGVIYAVASVAGPTIGGLFVDHLSWRWAFLINLPVGALSAAIVVFALHLPHRRIRHSLDIAGAFYLTTGLGCLVLVASLGGHDIGWASASMALLIGVMAALAVLFVRRERRAREPVLPFRLFANPVMRVSAGINLTSGMLLWCGIFLVPLFVQEVRGLSPTRSGLLLTPLMFGAAFGTLISGKRVERSGSYRVWPITGSLLSGGAIALLTQLDASTPIAWIALAVLMLGTGVGFVMQPSLLAAQNSVEHRDLGTATSTTLLFRVGGGTIGVPVLGGLLNAGLAGRARNADAFADVLPDVFLAALPVALACIVLSFILEERPLRDHVSAGPEPSDEPRLASEAL